MLDYEKNYNQFKIRKGSFNIFCNSCGAPNKVTRASCFLCDGFLDAYYDLSTATLTDSDNVIERYQDLLPVTDCSNVINNHVTMTPLISSQALARRFGVNQIYFKAECNNSTRSTKDKMAAIALTVLSEQKKFDIAMNSTGNSSTAFANLIGKNSQFSASIFTGKGWLSRLGYEDKENIRTFCLDVSYDELDKFTCRFAENHNLYLEGSFRSVSCREGLKLAYMEAYDQANRNVDFVFQAISSGMGLVAAYKGASEFLQLGIMSKVPSFIGVQQDSCNPMVRAANDNCETMGEEHLIENPQGIAKAILRGNPSYSYPYLRYLTKTTKGGFCSISDEEIYRAKKIVENETGLSICYNSAAAAAAFFQMAEKGQFPSKSNMLINLSGGNRDGYPTPKKIEYFNKKQLNTSELFKLNEPLKALSENDLTWVRCKGRCYSAHSKF